MKRVALYARVSTKDKGQNTDTQLIPLRDFAEARGLTITAAYAEVGWSGAKERRPQLDRLMTAARKHQFDVIAVVRFDRFARSVRHLLAALAEFQSLRIDFISLNESIDTSTPMGKMVFTILGAVAELERELIRERVQAGIERARRQGKKLGRPRALVDEVRLCEQIAEGQSVRSVAKAAGIARVTVMRIVRRYTEQKAFRAVATNPPPASLEVV